jgi:formylmethanofuran dehydrogenase subunit E
MTDAVSAVTGARLGRRSLKFVDYGKVAATFLNTETGEAYRIVALESSRKLADARHVEMPDRRQRQMLAYREATDEELFKIERVKVRLNELDLPGRPRSRVVCVECGESVNDGREVRAAEPLCRACANGSYYSNVQSASDNASRLL